MSIFSLARNRIQSTIIVGLVGSVLVASLAILLLIDEPTPPLEASLATDQSETARVMAGPEGHPDVIAQYHHDIRSSLDGINEYPTAYRIGEFRKAMMAAAKISTTELNWNMRGPGNVGGRTRPILVDPEDPLNTWWAGSASGGLWKTNNRGNTWIPVTDHLPNLAVSSLSMAESNPDIIYMGTGEGFYNLGQVAGDGMFKSSDRGITWEHLPATTADEDFRHVYRIAVHQADPDVVTAAAGKSIFRTSNGGDSWTKVYSGEKNIHDLRAQPGNFNMQIAAPYTELALYSQDAGMTWQRAVMYSPDIVGRTELTYSSADPNIAFATAESGSSRIPQLFRSEDGGLTWWPTVEKPGHEYYPSWLSGLGWYTNTIAVNPFRPTIVYAGGVFMVRVLIHGNAGIVGMPTELDYGGTEAWLNFVNFDASALGGRVSYLDPAARNVTTTDYADIEVRFGAGSQLAHRFVVAPLAGKHGNGGEGVPWSEYEFADYVEVPFQVWDVDNDRQLMISFRDQADDGEFDLIEFFTSTGPGTRNQQSHEYLIIHKYDYDATAAHDNIARDDGIVDGMLYFLWPSLSSGATWDPDNLSNQSVNISFTSGNPRYYEVDKGLDVYNNAHVDHHDLVTIPIDSAAGTFWVLNANDGGIALSSDSGLTFVELDRPGSGYNTSQFYGVAKAPGQSRYMGGMQDNGSYMSPENPSNDHAWTHVLGGDGFDAVWHSTDPNLVLGSWQYTHIERSADGGLTWDQQMEGNALVGNAITSLGYADSAPDNVYTVRGDGVWRSTDFGASWTLTRIEANFGKYDGTKIRVSNADPDVVWAGIGLANSPCCSIQVSRDAGVSFAETAIPVMDRAPETYISGLATHPAAPGTAFALFSRYSHAKVLETKNYGQTWTDLSGFSGSPDGRSMSGFPDVAVYDLIVMPHAPSTIWVGTEIGLFESTNYGRQWQYANNGIPPVSIWSMKIRDGEVILGTHGRGIWTVPLSEITGEIASPSFRSETIADQQFQVGSEINPVILPAAYYGLGELSYSLFPQLPAQLTFDAPLRKISGTPTVEFAQTEYVYTVTDAAGAQASITFKIEVASDYAPSFASVSLDTLDLIEGQRIEPIVLPAAIGGNQPNTYTISPDLPSGLKFDPDSRILSGTPDMVASPTAYSYTATDLDGDTASVSLVLGVSAWTQVNLLNAVTGQPVDMYLNGLRIQDDLSHGSQGPLTLGAGERVFNITLSDAENDHEPLASVPVTLLPHHHYYFMLFSDGAQLRLAVKEDTRVPITVASQTLVMVAHGAPDLDNISVRVIDSYDNSTVLNLLGENIAPGRFGDYEHLQIITHLVQVTSAINGQIIDVYQFDLAQYGDEVMTLLMTSGSELVGVTRLGELIQPTVKTSAENAEILPDEPFVLDGSFPNPFTSGTRIQFHLGEPARVSVTVTDVLGRRVLSLPEQEFNAGANQGIDVSMGHLASGLYLYRVEATTETGVHISNGRMTLTK